MGKMKKWGANLITFVKKYKFTILALTLLMLIVILIAGNYNNKHWLILLSIYCLLNVLAKSKKYISIPITILFAFLLAVDVYFPIIYGEKLSFGIVEAVVHANAAEVSSMFLEVVFTLSLITLTIAATFLLSQRELIEVKPGIKVSLLVFASYWLILIPVYSVVKVKTNEEIKDGFEWAPAYVVYHFIGHKFPLFFRSSTLYLAYKEQSKPKDAYRFVEREIPIFASLDSTAISISPNKIYIVIGESATRSHLSLYGYSINTTPFVDNLVKVDSTFRYYNGISGASMTQTAIPLALTYGYPANTSPMYEYKSLLEMAKNAGYEVLWISSQGTFGVADSKIGVFSSVADRLHYAEIWPPNDIALVDKMKEWLNVDKRQLFILHLEGSHADYKERYDKADADAIVGDGIVVDYDRTIHHTDRVIESLYNTIKDDESSVMFYFSDHGEIVGKGHGFVNEGAEQFEVPLLTLQRNQPRLDSLIHQYQDDKGYFSTINVINVLTELVGYKYEEGYRKKAVEQGKTVNLQLNVYHLI